MKKSILVLIAVVVVVAAALFALERWATRPQTQYLQGQVESRRVMVAAKIPGRLQSVLVREGDMVEKGQELAILESPEIEAKKMQAMGAVKAAEAQYAKAKTGARKEEIQAAKAAYDRAKEAADLAQVTYKRVQKLFDEGVLPAQKRDEALTQMRAARSAAEATQAQYHMAQAGARTEDKDASEGLVMQAEGSKAEVDAYLDETRLVAPIAGEISMKTAEEGEIVGAGMPVVAVSDLTDSWVVFNIREDLLGSITKGKKITVRIPALNEDAELEVYYIAPLGDFATWRSSKESGGFDLKTFEVRARPTQAIENLRPGMSALLPLPGME
ncbi:MAG: efflux RND transporter periplasmic adaptor subunit [Fibrobacter sp.]|jgi:HlyD family secretion protein|nr:efflux RND transporter periplasmic adaptor subunit [Fibrobacter sp.]